MIVFKNITDITEYLICVRNENKGHNIGFVPTMGALHEGHMSLIRTAKSENQIVVCSIYVNPLQFNNKQDYEKYPRNYSTDLEMLEKADCDIVFLPDTDEMQPKGEYPDYDLNGMDKVMEGKFRPGHFRGVVYIVTKFFEIIKPDNAYFGMKDFQQLTIIKYVVNNLRLTSYNLRLINIVGCPIVRDVDGLALSSRNVRLNAEQRNIAPNIYKTLIKVKEFIKTSQVFKTSEAYQRVKKEIEKYQLMKLEYFEIVDIQRLLPIKDNAPDNAIACIAVFLGDTRLIDNIEIC
jgi:pantoate--beta-alanine ligase